MYKNLYIEKIILNIKYILNLYFLAIKIYTMRLHIDNVNINKILNFATIFYIFPLLIELIILNSNNIGIRLLFIYITINTANEYINNKLTIKTFYSIIDILYYYIICKIGYYIYNNDYYKVIFVLPTFIYIIYLFELKKVKNK